jgi:arginase
MAPTSMESRPELLWLPLSEVRSQGVSKAAHDTLSHLLAPPLEGYWIHLDVDVLDDEVMPAVDSRQPDGMSYTELGEILLELVMSSSAVGMEITILDPDLDPDGAVVDRFVTFIEQLFAGSSRAGFGSA